MAKALQHSQAALIAWISTTGTTDDEPVPDTARSGRANAIISPSRWYKKSVRSLPCGSGFTKYNNATNFTVTGESHYAEMVREARRQRRLVDGSLTDWIVVRNRLAALGSRNKRLVGEGIAELSKRMGFRSVDGLAERVVYREFFPRGLTALDDLDEETLGTRPNMSHVTAREEVIQLLNSLRLPMSENGKRRAAARAEWYSVMDQPLQVHDVI